MSPEEIKQTKNIILGSVNGSQGTLIFNTITLQEPAKSEMLHYFLSSTDPPRFLFPRRSISIAWNGETGRVYEITVNLNSGKIKI